MGTNPASMYCVVYLAVNISDLPAGTFYVFNANLSRMLGNIAEYQVYTFYQSGVVSGLGMLGPGFQLTVTNIQPSFVELTLNKPHTTGSSLGMVYYNLFILNSWMVGNNQDVTFQVRFIAFGRNHPTFADTIPGKPNYNIDWIYRGDRGYEGNCFLGFSKIFYGIDVSILLTFTLS